jgi:Holliday junction resolvase RusA-like endonuclease
MSDGESYRDWRHRMDAAAAAGDLAAWRGERLVDSRLALLPLMDPGDVAEGMVPRPVVTIRAVGDPAPQGSKSASSVHGQDAQRCKSCRRLHVVRVSLHESSLAVGPWRQAVAFYAKLEMLGREVLDGPLEASMVFSLARPASHYLPVNSRRAERAVRPSAPLRPSGYPDVSKLARSTEDALTGVVWKDDARVVEYRPRLAKVWCGEDPDSLPVPGAVITVRQWVP